MVSKHEKAVNFIRECTLKQEIPLRTHHIEQLKLIHSWWDKSKNCTLENRFVDLVEHCTLSNPAMCL